MDDNESYESPLMDNLSEKRGGNIRLSNSPFNDGNTMIYATYGIIAFIVIMILYSAYCSFCDGQNSYFLTGSDRDDPEVDSFIEDQIETLKRRQERNLHG
jgi:hypothetical protein